MECEPKNDTIVKLQISCSLSYSLGFICIVFQLAVKCDMYGTVT
jgi:hypothetical protein